MAAPASIASAPQADSRGLREFVLHPSTRVALRWAFIFVVTLVAFWPSLVSLAMTTRGGGLNGYLWMVPVAAILAAQGVARRPRTELPIHDRQTDMIVGGMGLVLALLLHGVLLQRYALYFHLLRLDFLAMYVFVLSSAIVLFGLRPVARFAWVWLLSLFMFVLPYHVLVILLGGGRVAAGGATLIIAGAATGISVGRTSRRGWIGGLAAWGVGLAVLVVMAIFFPYAPVTVYQEAPALIATALVGMVMFLLARRGQSKRAMNRKVEPIAARQVLAGLPLVLVVGILLALVKLPIVPAPPVARFSGLQISGPLNPPAGWHITETADYPWVKRLHGRIAHLTRQRMVANVGNPQWDKLSRPRTVVVDNVVSDRPFSFNVYPVKVLYDVSATRLSKPRRVDLGYGVVGEAVSVVDDHLLVTWNMLQWTWRNDVRAQRVLLISVDNHDDSAPFPNPSGALLPTLSTLFTVLFRGNSAVDDRNPTFKDIDLLTTFGRGLVRAQIEPLGRLS
jgi:xanthosine utilization system XapX-like protein